MVGILDHAKEAPQADGLADLTKPMAWLTLPSRDASLICEMAGFKVNGIHAKPDEFKAGKCASPEPLIATH